MAKQKSKPNIAPKKEHPQKGKLSQHMLIATILFVFSCILYANTIHHGFVLDDPLAIELNKNVTSGFGGIGDIIKGSYRENNFGGQLYRPVSLVQFAIEWDISPNNPMIHHFFNVFWYAILVVCIFFLLTQWIGKSSTILAMMASLVFAVHPIHTEVVANIKSRDEIMSLLFVIVSFYAWGKYLKGQQLKWLISSIFIYFLALISKESAITMVPIFALIGWCVFGKNWKNALSKGALFLIPVVILLVIRQTLFGDLPTPVVDVMDNPIVQASGLIGRWATAMVILWKYVTLLTFPYPLSSDYSFTVIPLAGLNNILVWVSAALHLGLLLWGIRLFKSNKYLALAIFGYFLSISLSSQLFIVIGTMFGERLAFLPSFWWILGIMTIIFSLFKIDQTNDIKTFIKQYPIVTGLVAMIVIVYSGLTISRNADWKDNYTLFTKDVATYPQSVRLNNGAADQTLILANQEGISETEINSLLAITESYCEKIMIIKPVATAYLTLGNIRIKQKRYADAIHYYDQVNDLKNIVDVNKALAYREMGREAGEKENDLQKSQEMLRKSLELNDKDAQSWFLMGVSYGVSGNHQLAGENFEKAYALNPSPDYARNVVVAYQNIGNMAKVAEYQKYIGQ